MHFLLSNFEVLNPSFHQLFFVGSSFNSHMHFLVSKKIQTLCYRKATTLVNFLGMNLLLFLCFSFSSGALLKYLETTSGPQNLYPQFLKPFDWSTWYSLCDNLKELVRREVYLRSFDKSFVIHKVFVQSLLKLFPNAVISFHEKSSGSDILETHRFGDLLLYMKDTDDFHDVDFSHSPRLYNAMNVGVSEEFGVSGDQYPFSHHMYILFAFNEEVRTWDKSNIIYWVNSLESFQLPAFEPQIYVLHPEHHEPQLFKIHIALSETDGDDKSKMIRIFEGVSPILQQITKNMTSFHPSVFMPTAHLYIYSSTFTVLKAKSNRISSRFDSISVQKKVLKQTLSSTWKLMIPNASLFFSDDYKFSLSCIRDETDGRKLFWFYPPRTKFNNFPSSISLDDQFCVFFSSRTKTVSVNQDHSFELEFIMRVPKEIQTSKSFPLEMDDF